MPDCKSSLGLCNSVITPGSNYHDASVLVLVHYEMVFVLLLPLVKIGIEGYSNSAAGVPDPLNNSS